jgi:hypothetical protein
VGEGISIELGSFAVYLEERTRRFFGKDTETLDWQSRLNRRIKISLEQAASIQCVGMEHPIGIEKIYQPIGLEGKEGYRSGSRSRTDILTLIELERDGIIFAGPGRGKTTVLNWLLLHLVQLKKHTPILFQLRTERAVEELGELVTRLADGLRTGVPRGDGIILLVDGYDEIDERQRASVSATLTHFRSLKLGNFYLTCRSFYDVYDLKTDNYRLAAFTEEDSRNFIVAFGRCYGCDMDAGKLIDALRMRGLWDFATHPLMLTLICMLKTSTLPELPQNSLYLLKRAFDTLTFRWDEQKGVRRRSKIPVDGEDRVSCLMRIAYQMNGLIATQDQVEAYARYFLKLLQRTSIDPRRLLNEIAQWYGVLVPADGDKWQFAHRCIHDYLAARFAVEKGYFDPAKVRVWNARAAYSVCLTHDATRGMKVALENSRDLHAFSECLYNKVPFDVDEVSRAVLVHFRQYRPFLHEWHGNWLTVEVNHDFTELASEQFLMRLIETALREYPRARDSSDVATGTAHDVVLALAFAELKRRKQVINDLETEKLALSVFDSFDFMFQVGVEEPYLVRLGEVFQQHSGWRLLPPS